MKTYLRNLFLAFTCCFVFVSCVEDSLFDSNATDKTTSNAIKFYTYEKGMTRAATQMENANHDNFGVFGFYEQIKTGNLADYYIMDNYLVKYSTTPNGSTWGDGTGNITDNLSYWFYDGLKEADGAKQEQYLKYWNGSTNNSMWTYFLSYAPYNKAVEYYHPEVGKDTLVLGSVSSFYINPVEQVDGITQTNTNDIINENEILFGGKSVFQTSYGNDVQLLFSHANPRIKIGFWEDIPGYDVELIDFRPVNTVVGGPQFVGYDEAQYLNNVTPQVRDANTGGGSVYFKGDGTVGTGKGSIHEFPVTSYFKKSDYPDGITANDIKAYIADKPEAICAIAYNRFTASDGNDTYWYITWFGYGDDIDSDSWIIATQEDGTIKFTMTVGGYSYGSLVADPDEVVFADGYEPSSSNTAIFDYTNSPLELYSDFLLVPSHPDQAAWPTSEQLKNQENGQYTQEYGTTTKYNPGTEFYGQPQWTNLLKGNQGLAYYTNKANGMKIANLGDSIMYYDGKVIGKPSPVTLHFNDTTQVLTNLRFKKPTGKISEINTAPSYSPTLYYPLAHNYTEDNVGFTLKVSYKLIPKDGTASIFVYDARVYITPNYCNWQNGKQYTYIIKLTKDSNGTTNPGKVDPCDPSTPYVDPDDPRVITDKALKPIVFEAIVENYDDGNIESEHIISE